MSETAAEAETSHSSPDERTSVLETSSFSCCGERVFHGIVFYFGNAQGIHRVECTRVIVHLYHMCSSVRCLYV
jgi:hypothetical protein